MTLLKSIVAGLVLANVAYFLWSRGIANTPEAAAAGPATLKLASESAAGAAKPAPSEPGETAFADARGASAVGAPAAGTPAIGAPVIGTPVSDTAPPEATALGGLISSVKRCVSVGPFRDFSEAAHAAGTLRRGGYDPRQRVADGEVWAGVWVYLPLPAERAAADQVLDKLKAAGIDDALEMPGPNDTSVISLGLFSEPKRAQARVAQAQALSLNPAVADRKRNGNVYWIDIDLKPTDAMLSPSDLQAGEAGHIVRLEVKACPSTAGGQP